MKAREEAESISMDKYKSKQFDITKQNETKKINIETVFSINEVI